VGSGYAERKTRRRVASPARYWLISFCIWFSINGCKKHFPCIHFERNADDIVVHCRSENQLKRIAHQIRRRFIQCGLELCEEKTKIVYCKDSNRSGSYPNQSFDFLGYTFRPRSVHDSNGRFFVSFSPAVSRKALKAMRAKLKGHPLIKAGYNRSIEELAKAINPIIQGWIAYYGRFRKSAMSVIYSYINDKLLKVSVHPNHL
jgi:RNA-directed DNA polymerase